MKKIKLIYKKNDEWDYLRDTDWGGQLWGCNYTLDMDATNAINGGEYVIADANRYISIYTDDITDDELDALDGAGYDRLPWDDYEYYTTLGDLVDWAGSSVIPCVMDGNNIIITATVNDCGRIICEEA